MAKRAFDILVSFIALLVLLPLLLLLALCVALGSPGGAFFRQTRVGKDGRNFQLLKFRSMRPGSEAQGQITVGGRDPRITGIGQFLRKSKLDELPQLWNVLRGEMSFVGPRPERPYFVELLKEKIPYWELRHYVKPGITGWAQVMYRYGASVDDAYHKLEYDLYYAKKLSFRLDVLILLKTIGVVIRRKGR